MASTTSPARKPSLKLNTTEPSHVRFYSHLLYVDTPTRNAILETPGSACSSSVSSIASTTSAHSAKSSHTNISFHSQPSQKYADDHYPLITTLNLHQHLPHNVLDSHPAVWSAHHMAQIHNTIIRALNSAYNHCLSISPSTTAAKDFLFFNAAIASSLHHHHQTEDDFLFPALEKLMGQPDALQSNNVEHESFMEGLMVYTKYVTTTKSDEYNGLTLRHIIDSFAPSLIQHLHAEIPSLLSTHVIRDEAALMAVWKEAERLALKDADMYVTGPLFLCSQDRDFRIDGRPGDFPGMPWMIEKLVKSWYSRRHAGAWRFCGSDFEGRRRLIGSI